MMSFIFIAFTHGLALPILFPITFCALSILYIKEKLCYVYIYRQPPLMNNKINNGALWWLGFAPAMMLGYGYW